MDINLKEENFFNEKGKRSLFPFLFSAIAITFLSSISWELVQWSQKVLGNAHSVSPFHQVTNRDFSLFLWENPSS